MNQEGRQKREREEGEEGGREGPSCVIWVCCFDTLEVLIIWLALDFGSILYSLESIWGFSMKVSGCTRRG